MITQANHCHLDQVLLTFGWLFLHFNHLTDPLDAPIRDNILGSIETRWDKCDQDVFIAAVVLNPFHFTKPFKASHTTSRASITLLLIRLYERLYKVDTVPPELHREINDYLTQSGPHYSLMSGYAQHVAQLSASQVCSNWITFNYIIFIFRDGNYIQQSHCTAQEFNLVH